MAITNLYGKIVAKLVDTQGILMEKLLTLQDVIKMLSVSDKTLRKIMREGKLKFQRVGREFRFREQWVIDFLEGG